MNRIKPRRLTSQAMRPYGYIIDSSCVRYKGDTRNGFGIVLKERSGGWRIAYLVVRERSIRRLESHPDTVETFEPVKGRAVIALARRGRPDAFELFFLDKPIAVKKGIWHDVASLSNSAEIKIFENIKVTERYHHLKDKIII